MHPPSFGCNRQLYRSAQGRRIARSERVRAAYSGRMVRAEAKQAAAAAEGSSWLHAVARVGFVVLGVVHAIIGVLAFVITRDPDDVEVDQSGAMLTLARTPVGGVLLWIVALGFLALCAWELIEAVLVPGRDRPRRWARRLPALAKAVAYAAVGGLALVFALGGRLSAAATGYDVSATLIAVPGGAWLLIAAGLATLGAGVGFVVAGVRRTFRNLLRMPSGTAGRIVTVVGVVGYVGKGIALGVVGVLVVIGAAMADPRAASGLDGALTELVTKPYGEILVWISGAGFIVYGAFCGLRAAFARL